MSDRPRSSAAATSRQAPRDADATDNIPPEALGGAGAAPPIDPGAATALRALLAEIIDYAGMFPPARLELEPAIRNYARYRSEPESWLLGRFICPAAKLAALAPFVRELFRGGPPLRLSVLASGGETAAQFRERLVDDVAAMGALYSGDGAEVDAIEARLPIGANADAIASIVGAARDALRGSALKPALFFEPFLTEDWRDTPEAAWRGPLTGADDALADASQGAGAPIGLKLRCGGLAPAAFPPVEAVAGVIEACRARRLPLKFTAGLHHPLRHFSAEVSAEMHGFLNVFLAGVLAGLGAGAVALRDLLDERSASAFVFTQSGVAWRGQRASAPEIAAARRSAVLSFGSCSFDEPRADLRRLGLLS